MAFTSTSKFVQLTPYLLMEYMYADQPTPETYFTSTGTSTVGFDKLVNGYMSNSVQIFNPTADYSVTHNGTEDSVVKIAENSFVTLDSNLIIPFNDYSDQLTDTSDLPVVFPYNLSVVYDTVRYHIRAGYNLNNVDGIILGIDYQDQNLTYVTFSQILIQKGTQQEYVFNPNPVTIGANIYDKYFEIKIPNLKSMNDTYLATPSNFQASSLAGLLSASGKGFVYGAPLRISLWQVQGTTDYVGYSRYDCARISLLSLEEEDPFSNIGATIQEADKGQFFEYFATDNEGFIEDFILFQNSIGNAYYINHQIEVLEQIGAAIIETSRFESIQTSAYDTPNYYRPIVKNAAYASTFFLRYTMSLINSADQSSVVRIATYSSNNPSAWGLNITPIQLSNFPQVQKIYNRVYDQPQITMGGSNTPQPKEILKFTNVFIDQNYITGTYANLVVRNGLLTEDTGDKASIALGSGKLTIKISPFDNYYKFKFVQSGPEGNPVSIDLSSSGTYNMSFLDDQGTKTYVKMLNDNTIARPAMGELAFKVDESTSGKILQFKDKRFFIVNGGGSPLGATGTNLMGIAASSDMSVSANTERAYSADVLSSIVTTTNTLNPDATKNVSASVVYWGYWKAQGEPDIIPVDITPVGVTGSTGPVVIITPVGSGTQVLGEIEPIVLVSSKPAIKDVNPAFVKRLKYGYDYTLMDNYYANTNISRVNVISSGAIYSNQIMTGSALTSALSAQIQGFVNSGWTDQNIIDYFLIPGNPGYQQYPGLTPSEFVIAANGILSPASISSIGSYQV